MKPLCAACVILAGCGNYGNVYLPEGERRPLVGPAPTDFPAARDFNSEAVQGSLKLRLNLPPRKALTLVIEGDGAAAPVTIRLNTRSLLSVVCNGRCRLAVQVPLGTVVPDTAALVEITTPGPFTLRRVSYQR